jgi:hypothetical protein
MDMINLALWLKERKFKLDQVQNFYPSPLANATTIYHSEVDSLHKVTKKSEKVAVPKGAIQRRLHKAILRYHDPKNWAQIRDALKSMGLARLIGKSPQHLVPPESREEQRTYRGAGKGRGYGSRASSGDKGSQRAVTKHTAAQFAPGKPKKPGKKNRG